MGMTITEALAEIKTIGKRLEKKRATILQYIARDVRLKDPLENDGGSVEFIRKERQSIKDFEERIVAIRTAINSSNLIIQVTIEGETRSVFEWLTFRREVADGRKRFLGTLSGGINSTREKVQREGGRISTAGISSVAIVEAPKPVFEVMVHIDEKALFEEQELMEKILGDLDGKLSLLNATTTVEV